MLPNVHPALGTTPHIQLFRTILTLATHLRTLMDQRLAAIGLTTQQAAVLTFVDAASDPLALGEVAATLGTTHQNARQIVTALERKGLVTITVDPNDRRARRIAVTPVVASLFSDHDIADHEQVAEWLAVLTEAEQTQAVALLSRVLRQLVLVRT